MRKCWQTNFSASGKTGLGTGAGIVWTFTKFLALSFGGVQETDTAPCLHTRKCNVRFPGRKSICPDIYYGYVQRLYLWFVNGGGKCDSNRKLNSRNLHTVEYKCKRNTVDSMSRNRFVGRFINWVHGYNVLETDFTVNTFPLKMIRKRTLRITITSAPILISNQCGCTPVVANP